MVEKHALEREFGLSYWDILEAINNRPRCKMAVRGAIAEVHLEHFLQGLKDKKEIESFYAPTGDGKPDFEVRVGGQPYLVECKNVEKEKPRKDGAATPITIDFQKTRTQRREGPEGRYYPPDHFSVVAACLWNRTGRWEFMFAATATLERHPTYPERLSQKLRVSLVEDERWTSDLPSLLTRDTTQSLSVNQVPQAIPLELATAEEIEI